MPTAISLFLYNRERRTVIDDLTMHGWDVSAYSGREMYARNGLEFREGDKFVAAFGNASYVSGAAPNDGFHA